MDWWESQILLRFQTIRNSRGSCNDGQIPIWNIERLNILQNQKQSKSYDAKEVLRYLKLLFNAKGMLRDVLMDDFGREICLIWLRLFDGDPVSTEGPFLYFLDPCWSKAWSPAMKLQLQIHIMIGILLSDPWIRRRGQGKKNWLAYYCELNHRNIVYRKYTW